MDSTIFLNEVRSTIDGMTNLYEMVEAVCQKYNLTEEAAREYIMACAFADSLNIPKN